MTSRDRARLTGVHPTLIEKVTEVLGQMDKQGHPMFVVMGLRSAAEQAALYAQGRTQPGHVVTYKDGYVHKSNHQAHADGFGHAVDCAFAGPLPFDEHAPWDLYGAAVEAAGLTWGGRWEMLDKPHCEMV